MTAIDFIGIALVLFVAIGALADAPTPPAYTMTRSRRRQLMRERARLNPELNPIRWRLS